MTRDLVKIFRIDYNNLFSGILEYIVFVCVDFMQINGFNYSHIPYPFMHKKSIFYHGGVGDL